MCILCTPRPIYRPTYRPTLERCIGRHIGRHSADVLTEIYRSSYRPMYQPRYRPSDGRHIDHISADISVDIAADTRPIRWPLIVGGVSVDCRWHIGRLSCNSQKFRVSVAEVYKPVARKRGQFSRSGYVDRYIGRGLHKIHVICNIVEANSIARLLVWI